MRTLECCCLIVVAWLAMVPAAQSQWPADPFHERQGRYHDRPRQSLSAVPSPYYPPPVVAPHRAYPPPAVAVPSGPGMTYGVPAPQFWYWCDNPRGYHPDVATCHGQWRAVSDTRPR
jgi:hypothetical protein